ncbi:EAL domain-containing protein [Pararobbsia silviterrae]|uniref:EAL domain-containing protein n=1 Tax=Pararobbsia silviterrae TaxID=1792498 RepID=A0A494Y455_9BURK|nr:EAL domain-containing protein [Pararobbsia silviterrae]RKP57538.1 EAL domain-containing protein [Pararobbsia silviterrae]
MTRVLPQQAGLSFGLHDDEFVLGTAFQPIVGLIHQRVVGYEALVRGSLARSARAVTPYELFESAARVGELVRLDSACQRIHLQTFSQVSSRQDWLFLNVRPESIAVPNFPQTLIERIAAHDLAPRQIVIELLETPHDRPVELERSIAELRASGFVIALDDFGAGHSNLDRVLDLKPDLIKLDRRLTIKATQDRAIRRVLPTMISMLHEIGTLVVAEGIETAIEASIALDSGADLAQGFFFGLPSPELVGLDRVLPRLDLMRAETTAEHARRNGMREARLEPHRAALAHAAELFLKRAVESEIAAVMLAHPDAARCYVVDEDGMQFGHVYTRGVHVARFLPLDDESGANWESRPYFRKAMESVGEVVSTVPYLSISGSYMCVTMALAVERDGRRYLLGVDVDSD